MAFNAFTISLVVVILVCFMGLVFWGLLSTGLQEADDPDESQPEDLTEFEKRHVDRSDVSP